MAYPINKKTPVGTEIRNLADNSVWKIGAIKAWGWRPKFLIYCEWAFYDEIREIYLDEINAKYELVEEQ